MMLFQDIDYIHNKLSHLLEQAFVVQNNLNHQEKENNLPTSLNFKTLGN